MVQILPRFDPGGEIGKSFGSGVGQALGTQADRQRMLSGLESLNNLDFENMSYGDLIKTTAKSFVGLPGGMQVLQEILPGLIKQKQSVDYANNAYGGEDKPGGSVDLDKTSQMIEKSIPGVGQEVISQTDEMQMGAPRGAAAGARPELAPTSQKVPGLEEDIPAYRPMTNQERQQRAKSMAKGGFSPSEIQKAINDEEQRRRDEWKGLVEAKKARTEQFVEERGLEDIQEDRVKGYVSEEIGVSQAEVDPYEMQKGYEYFKEAQKKNPNMKDRQLWNHAKKDFQGMRESFSRGENMLERPQFLSLSADRRIADARKWAQGHLKSYGNFRQDREKLLSLFTNNGYTKAEAASIVKPLSEGLEKTVKDIGKATKKERFGYQGTMEHDVPLRGKDREKYTNKLAEDIATNIKPTDSILLLRERLVRDDAVDEQMFSDALEQAQQMMEEQGKTLNPEQQGELPDLQNKVKPSLLDIIIGEEKFDIRKYFPRLQR